MTDSKNPFEGLPMPPEPDCIDNALRREQPELHGWMMVGLDANFDNEKLGAAYHSITACYKPSGCAPLRIRISAKIIKEMCAEFQKRKEKGVLAMLEEAWLKLPRLSSRHQYFNEVIRPTKDTMLAIIFLAIAVMEWRTMSDLQQ